ncbi:hypothetical protein Pmar_PMAR001832, partial [Perkinsus marinus ATCC 50983]
MKAVAPVLTSFVHQASECRAKNDAGQTLYWRLWHRGDFYSFHNGNQPLVLRSKPDAELTVAFLVDGL